MPGTGQIQEVMDCGASRRLHHVGDDENLIEYELIRSNRKTLTIQVKPDGRVFVRAPVRLAKYRIAKFVKDHETWIFVQQEKLEKYRENMHVITDEERQEGILQAKKIFPERTAYFAERMGCTYNRHDPGTENPLGKLQLCLGNSTQLEAGTDAIGTS